MISKLSFMAVEAAAVTLTLFFPEIGNHGVRLALCYCLKEVEDEMERRALLYAQTIHSIGLPIESNRVEQTPSL